MEMIGCPSLRPILVDHDPITRDVAWLSGILLRVHNRVDPPGHPGILPWHGLHLLHPESVTHVVIIFCYLWAGNIQDSNQLQILSILEKTFDIH